MEKPGPPSSSSSSSSPPPLPLFLLLLFWRIAVSQKFSDNSFILELGACFGTEDDPCAAHHGWFGWVSPLFFVSPGSWRDLGGRGGALPQRKPDPELFWRWQLEPGFFFSKRERETANPLNWTWCRGLSSSRKEDADKPHHLPPGALCAKDKSVSALHQSVKIGKLCSLAFLLFFFFFLRSTSELRHSCCSHTGRNDYMQPSTSGHIWFELHTGRREWLSVCVCVCVCVCVRWCPCWRRPLHPAVLLVFLQGNHLLISAVAKTNKSTGRSKYGLHSHWGDPAPYMSTLGRVEEAAHLDTLHVSHGCLPSAGHRWRPFMTTVWSPFGFSVVVGWNRNENPESP